jgi:hypothetical protein
MPEEIKFDKYQRSNYPQCDFCQHRLIGRSCKAFETIPEDYWMDIEKHDQVVDGQKGTFVYALKK